MAHRFGFRKRPSGAKGVGDLCGGDRQCKSARQIFLICVSNLVRTHTHPIFASYILDDLLLLGERSSLLHVIQSRRFFARAPGFC